MKARGIIFWLCMGAALGAVLELLPRPTHNVFWGVVYNAGHTPLFGAGSLVLLPLSRLAVRVRV